MDSVQVCESRLRDLKSLQSTRKPLKRLLASLATTLPAVTNSLLDTCDAISSTAVIELKDHTLKDRTREIHVGLRSSAALSPAAEDLSRNLVMRAQQRIQVVDEQLERTQAVHKAWRDVLTKASRQDEVIRHEMQRLERMGMSTDPAKYDYIVQERYRQLRDPLASKKNVVGAKLKGLFGSKQATLPEDPYAEAIAKSQLISEECEMRRKQCEKDYASLKRINSDEMEELFDTFVSATGVYLRGIADVFSPRSHASSQTESEGENTEADEERGEQDVEEEETAPDAAGHRSLHAFPSQKYANSPEQNKQHQQHQQQYPVQRKLSESERPVGGRPDSSNNNNDAPQRQRLSLLKKRAPPTTTNTDNNNNKESNSTTPGAIGTHEADMNGGVYREMLEDFFELKLDDVGEEEDKYGNRNNNNNNNNNKSQSSDQHTQGESQSHVNNNNTNTNNNNNSEPSPLPSNTESPQNGSHAVESSTSRDTGKSATDDDDENNNDASSKTGDTSSDGGDKESAEEKSAAAAGGRNAKNKSNANTRRSTTTTTTLKSTSEEQKKGSERPHSSPPEFIFIPTTKGIAEVVDAPFSIDDVDADDRSVAKEKENSVTLKSISQGWVMPSVMTRGVKSTTSTEASDAQDTGVNHMGKNKEEGEEEETTTAPPNEAFGASSSSAAANSNSHPQEKGRGEEEEENKSVPVPKPATLQNNVVVLDDVDDMGPVYSFIEDSAHEDALPTSPVKSKTHEDHEERDSKIGEATQESKEESSHEENNADRTATTTTTTAVDSDDDEHRDRKSTTNEIDKEKEKEDAEEEEEDDKKSISSNDDNAENNNDDHDDSSSKRKEKQNASLHEKEVEEENEVSTSNQHLSSVVRSSKEVSGNDGLVKTHRINNMYGVGVYAAAADSQSQQQQQQQMLSMQQQASGAMMNGNNSNINNNYIPFGPGWVQPNMYMPDPYTQGYAAMQQQQQQQQQQHYPPEMFYGLNTNNNNYNMNGEYMTMGLTRATSTRTTIKSTFHVEGGSMHRARRSVSFSENISTSTAPHYTTDDLNTQENESKGVHSSGSDEDPSSIATDGEAGPSQTITEIQGGYEEIFENYFDMTGAMSGESTPDTRYLTPPQQRQQYQQQYQKERPLNVLIPPPTTHPRSGAARITGVESNTSSPNEGNSHQGKTTSSAAHQTSTASAAPQVVMLPANAVDWEDNDDAFHIDMLRYDQSVVGQDGFESVVKTRSNKSSGQANAHESRYAESPPVRSYSPFEPDYNNSEAGGYDEDEDEDDGVVSSLMGARETPAYLHRTVSPVVADLTTRVSGDVQSWYMDGYQ